MQVAIASGEQGLSELAAAALKMIGSLQDQLTRKQSENEQVAADLAAMSAELDESVAAMSADLAEADRRAGAAERAKARVDDDAAKRASWLRSAKAEAGYDDNVSFDVVWAETLAKSRASAG